MRPGSTRDPRPTGRAIRKRFMAFGEARAVSKSGSFEKVRTMIYRPEIDGLRALAILPVIFFHAGFKPFGGGFVGVDVFFVISGYLITSVILAEIGAGTFTLAGFYERRARRLLPALFLVMMSCLPFAWFWMLPIDMAAFAKSLMAVAVFASNFLFWSESGYFDIAADLKPLLHTWSLAVEEQYYLLYPAFLLLALRLRRRWAVGLLLLIALVSLAVAQWGALHKPAATFYLLPTRGWELLIGAMAGFYLSNRAAPAKNGPMRHLPGLIGIALIVYAVFAFDASMPFPGLYALVPTTGAALVILFSTRQTMVGALLGSWPLVGIGLISYSAYLWHQPLFAFARYRSIHEPDTVLFLELSLIALALAWLSWKVVEKPFRDRTQFTRRQIVRSALLASAGFLAAGFAGVNSGFASRTGALAETFASIESIKTLRDSRCHTNRRSADQIAQGDLCVLGRGSIPSFAVIGDSHAGAIFEAFNAYPARDPFAFYAISGPRCAPLMNDFRLDRYVSDECVETTRQAFSRILKSDNIRDVVLVAEWPLYTTGYQKGFKNEGDGRQESAALTKDKAGGSTSAAENRIAFGRSLSLTVDTLRRAHKNVVIVTSVPEFETPVIPAITRGVFFDKSIEHIASFAPFITVPEYLARNAEVLDAFRHLNGVHFVDARGIFCDLSVCRSVSSDGRILFSDASHVTEYGARLIVSEVMRRVLIPGDRPREHP
jgi:peptidoglycan/LPS O-acetylase OafA/YrhL